MLNALAFAAFASYAAAGFAPQAGVRPQDDPKTTPAYGVLVLRKAAVEAELAHVLEGFKSQHPAVGIKRFELAAVGREMEKMGGLDSSLAPRLSETYGNLILRKVALEVELRGLLGGYKPQHPVVKRKQVELAALEREIEKILR